MDGELRVSVYEERLPGQNPAILSLRRVGVSMALYDLLLFCIGMLTQEAKSYVLTSPGALEELTARVPVEFRPVFGMAVGMDPLAYLGLWLLDIAIFTTWTLRRNIRAVVKERLFR